MNMRTITFNELRKIKDSLPSGSMHRIADELGLNVDTVRNFFGGHNFKEGKSAVSYTHLDVYKRQGGAVGR